MKVFIGFMLLVFFVSAKCEARGASVPTWALVLCTVVIAGSFFSLRVIE